MRNQWDVTTPKGKGVITVPKRLKSTGIKRLIERALWAQGIRLKLEEGKRRHEFQADHGFRKWFKTRCESAGMRSINIETLMSHSIGSRILITDPQKMKYSMTILGQPHN